MDDRLPIDGPSMQTLRRERDAAIAERDRLRRELEALRKTVEDLRFRDGWYLAGRVAARIDAILRGGES